MPHENEIIWTPKGGSKQTPQPPLDPPLIFRIDAASCWYGEEKLALANLKFVLLSSYMTVRCELNLKKKKKKKKKNYRVFQLTCWSSEPFLLFCPLPESLYCTFPFYVILVQLITCSLVPRLTQCPFILL